MNVVYSTVVNPAEQGAKVTIAAAYAITCSFIFLGIRYAVRWPLTKLFSWDDATLTGATAVAIAQLGLIVSAVDHGLGSLRTVRNQNISAVEKLIYASNLLYVLISFASRVSVALLINRLFKDHLQTRILVASCGVLGIISFLMAAIGPQPSTPWKAMLTLKDQYFSMKVVEEVFLCILDIAIVVVPMILVRDLQMTWRNKSKTVIAFALRLPTIVIAALRLASLSHALHNSRDFPFNYVRPQIFQQVELNWALISATIPSLRLFFRVTQTFALELDGSWTGLGDSQKGTRATTSQKKTTQMRSQDPQGLEEYEMESRKYGDHVSTQIETGVDTGDDDSFGSRTSQQKIFVTRDFQIQNDV